MRRLVGMSQPGRPWYSRRKSRPTSDTRTMIRLVPARAAPPTTESNGVNPPSWSPIWMPFHHTVAW